MNHAAIDRGLTGAHKVEVPKEWANVADEAVKSDIQVDRPELVDFVKNILVPVNAQQGDSLPVSAFKNLADGTFPQGSAAYEKRGIAVDVPEWQPENCIQCNFCSYVCPHGVIRPVVMTADEAAKAPAGMKLKDATGLPGYKFAITPSVLDCTGCGSCANVCPGMRGAKALVMKPIDSQLGEEAAFIYGQKLPVKPEVFAKFKVESVKGSQFKQPLLEFSGACAGCGETPYAKLATQLFGDRMYIANATGCSSIWGGSAPSTPYTVNKRGFGPTWANSLFEDNAEFGYGMYLGQQQIRDRVAGYVDKLIEANVDASLNTALENWKATREDGVDNREATDKAVVELEKFKNNEFAAKILGDKDFLAKKSIWIFGGDGWAYDIGFGGLDHVISSGMDVNILVFDTELYSNTGGQASKATPLGSVAQFAANGKSTKKKDLAGIAMTYGYVYVAQVAMGSDYNQCVKAFSEAEKYHGPSLIIAYAPCMIQGIKGGMGVSQTEEKNAVTSGYCFLFRYNPTLVAEGKNPFTLDSKEPTASYNDFILGEVRYSALTRSFPERAKELFATADQQAKEKYQKLVELTK
jgi:pyruvate-ferredoxin/flavodoxin oxidoreductase